MASSERGQTNCKQQDIIRVPMTSGTTLRVLAVCSKCGAFRDVTGLSASDAYRALHEAPDAGHQQ